MEKKAIARVNTKKRKHKNETKTIKNYLKKE